MSTEAKNGINWVAVVTMMFLCGIYIDNFHGLWGVYKLPLGVAIALTLVSCVGIINSINLIDGVDGLCSGYGMFASLLYGICFLRMGDVSYAVLAFSLFGSLIPFLLHNVFGKKYKMFLGDGGSLVLGFICSLYVMRVIQSGSDYITGSTISFTLAVLAIPVFDTLRVMTARMAKLVRDDVVLKHARQHQQLVVERYIVSAVAAPPPPAVGPERYRAAVKRKAPRKFAHPCAKPSAEF